MEIFNDRTFSNLMKSRNHKYLKRTGTKGNYEYFYGEDIHLAESKKKVERLGLVEITLKGITFKTGQKVTFPYLRNTESSKQFNPLKKFQAAIEPHGRYMSFNEMPNSKPPDKWVKGDVTFNNPLVLKFNVTYGASYDENSWKARLFEIFRKSGKALSTAIKKRGYDAIITVDGKEISEILSLKGN